jgi:hypothetical protein
MHTPSQVYHQNVRYPSGLTVKYRVPAVHLHNRAGCDRPRPHLSTSMTAIRKVAELFQETAETLSVLK